MTATSGVLRNAKQKILALGWHQGSFDSENGALCAVGAINLVQTGGADDPSGDLEPALFFLRSIYRADDYESLEWDDLMERVGGWNDFQSRTIGDVLAAFDRAIALAESEAA